MVEWWSGFSLLNQAFLVAAVFFTTLFVWQLSSALSGLGGEGDADADMEVEVDVDVDLDMDGDVAVDVQDVTGHDADLYEDAAGLATFRLLSVRSFIAFGMLFSWAGGLYLAESRSTVVALLLAAVWGLAGMLVVALFFWMLPRLTEEGTQDLDTAVGQVGRVYMNIPEHGAGQVRVVVSGTIKYVRARSVDGSPILAGEQVRVTGRLDASTLQVVAISDQDSSE